MSASVAEMGGRDPSGKAHGEGYEGGVGISFGHTFGFFSPNLFIPYSYPSPILLFPTQVLQVFVACRKMEFSGVRGALALEALIRPPHQSCFRISSAAPSCFAHTL